MAITDAFELDAEYVIYAAAMSHYGDSRATGESIRTATRNSLENADELDCVSIVIHISGREPLDLSPGKGTSRLRSSLGLRTVIGDTRVLVYSQRKFDELESVTETYDE